MQKRYIVIAAAALLVIAGGAVVWRPAIAPVSSPQRFDRAQVQHGAELAAIGDCAGCHTASPGQTFAGGRPIATPFGTVFATNITPDPNTGIGQWSLAAFTRA